MAVHNNTVSESDRRKKGRESTVDISPVPPLIFPQHFQRQIRLERVVLFSNSLYSHWVKGGGRNGWGRGSGVGGGGGKGRGGGGRKGAGMEGGGGGRTQANSS